MIDVSNPLTPLSIVGAVDTPGIAFGVVISDAYAYVADDVGGLQVIDVSDPHNPQIVGTVDTHGIASGVAYANGYIYISDGDSGLEVVDVTDPQNPWVVGTLDLPAPAQRVTLSDNYALVADSEAGLFIVPLQCGPSSGVGEAVAGAGELKLRVSPNPGWREAFIRFALPGTNRVRATVHDASGRLVRALCDRTLTAGDHTLPWDGRNDAGVRVAGGTYLIRLATAEGTWSDRLIILR